MSQSLLKQKLDEYNSLKANQIILTISGTECVNCYANINYLLGKLQLDSTNSTLVIDGVPDRELDFFIEERLGVIPETVNVIRDNVLFQLLSDGNSSSQVFILHEDSIIYQEELRSISLNQFLRYRAQTIQIKELLVADITSFAGAIASSFQVLNDSIILVYNYFRNVVFIYNFQLNKIVNSIGGRELSLILDELLTLSELTQEDLHYNTTSDAQEFLSTVPYRVVPRNVYVSENYIYLPIEVLAYDISINATERIPDTLFQLKWFSFLLKYNREMQLISKFSFNYQVPGFAGFFNYLQESQMLNDSTLAMRVSTRSADSLYFYYNLNDSVSNPIPSFIPDCAYPEYVIPFSDGKLHVYYSQVEGKHYFFKPEPVVYEFSSDKKIILAGWDYKQISDTSPTNCWIDDIQFNNDGTIYIVGTQNYSNTWLCVYNSNFELLKKIKITDRPLIDTKIIGRFIYGLDITDEYGKFYKYEIIF